MRLTVAVAWLLAASVCAAAPIQITGLRLAEMADRSQLVVDLDLPATFSSFTLEDPPRLVVDLPGARLAAKLRGLKLSSSLVRRVRTGIRNGYDVRLVLDLPAVLRSETYLAGPHGERGHRLVVDVYHPDAREPAAPPLRLVSPPVKAPAPRGPAKSAAVAAPVLPPRDFVVAIDPGHGGRDPGAMGPGGTREKDVVLAIARRLKALVDAEPGMRAVLTRSGDRYLRLRQRIDAARRNQADLFISLHADAFTEPNAWGSSVYIVSNRGASSEAARWLASTENAADLVGGLSLADKNDEVASLLLDLSQEATLESSLKLADQVLRQLRKVGKVHKRRVERAGFVVLKAPDIPSILVETAFISNPKEEANLRDPAHQQRLAKAVMDGIRGYYRNHGLPQVLLAAAEPELPVEALGAASSQVHVIQQGESLADIARRYQISLPSLRTANGLSTRQLRMPAGTPLTIPGSGI